MAKYADLRFYAGLRDLLSSECRSGVISRTFDVDAPIGDMIEACGVPRTEVALILVDGAATDFSYRVQDGDSVSVYPPFSEFEIPAGLAVSPPPPAEFRFAVDAHLAALARHLRLLGFDAACDREWTDRELVEIATRSDRVLLTGDPQLLIDGAVSYGYVVRSSHPVAQLVEVVLYFELAPRARPFTRCPQCNRTFECDGARPVGHDLRCEPAAPEDDLICTQCGWIESADALRRSLATVLPWIAET